MKQPNMPILITIGIPLYNAELYIANTLESIICQEIDNIEILIVDDCGTDDSINIVKRIQSEHSLENTIRIIKHSSNKGVAEARNTIIREATGKYLFFIDADDIVSKGAISSLYSKAEFYQAEAVFGSFYISKNNVIEEFRKLPDLVLNGEDQLASYFYNGFKDNILCSTCNILLLRDFINKYNLTFPSLNYAEDLLFDYRMFPLIQKAVLTSDFTYTYITHPNSLSNYQSRNTIDINEAYRALYISKIIKDTFYGLSDKKYFPNKCAKDMKQILYYICGIIKHRKQLNGFISDKELCLAIKHPVPLSQILSFKEKKNINLFFYFLGILPSKLSIFIITCIGKKKEFI